MHGFHGIQGFHGMHGFHRVHRIHGWICGMHGFHGIHGILGIHGVHGFHGIHKNPQSGQRLPSVAFAAPYYTGITPWITPQTPNPVGVAAPQATIDESIANVDSDQTMAAPGGLQRSQAYFLLGGLSGSRRSWPRAATRACSHTSGPKTMCIDS